VATILALPLLCALLVLERWALLVSLHLLVVLVGVLVVALVITFSRASRGRLTNAGVALREEDLVEELVCWVRPRGGPALGRAIEQQPREEDVELHHKLKLELGRVFGDPNLVVAVLIQLQAQLEVLDFATRHRKGKKFVHADCTLRYAVDR